MTVDDPPDTRHQQYPSPPPESPRDVSPPSTNSSPIELTPDSSFEDAPKNQNTTNDVPKLPPNRLGELLGDTPTPFAPQPSPDSPTRKRSATTPTKDLSGRPVQGRTLTTPPSTRRARTPKTPLEVVTTRKGGVDGDEKRQTTVVHQTLAGDGVGDEESVRRRSKQSSADESTPSIRNFRSPPNSSTFPPLPLQSYLSLALSSPSSGGGGGLVTPSAVDVFSPRNTEAMAYGHPPHHPDDLAALAMERIMNFLLLPAKLEGALVFGILSCLDSWLYIFTILPLRFLKAVGVLISFWRVSIWAYFNYDGNKLQKRHRKSSSAGQEPVKRRKRDEKKASDLLPTHKADILRGMLLFTSCWILMRFDASRIYHSVRGQSGIKLYVIYNMLDFSDKLFSALGQDILECLFSNATLERRPDGRSKIWRPFGFFLLGLAYNIIHSLLLLYQVITLNVAVNSYSNALITLLLSVQFVEIKSTVLKRFDKENLFQLTCGDIVERFQLLLMLVIIGARNIVELGVWSLSPNSGGGVLPKSFTFFPSWTGQLMGPFFMVLGSEMIVDWLKHAYITKFNNIRPIVYERFLDIQCRDYYSHAFTYQNLTRRLGLPVLPLACLFIRATIQTYHMFLDTHLPSHLPPTSAATALAEHSAETSPTIAGIDTLLRRALSRSSFSGNSDPSSKWTDDIIAAGTMCVFLAACFLIFLAVKLALGVLLLGFARRRYRGIKDRERMHIHTGGRYGGATGVVQVSAEQRSRIFEGDPEGEKFAKDREKKGRDAEGKLDMGGLDKVERYKMVSKRIW